MSFSFGNKDCADCLEKTQEFEKQIEECLDNCITEDTEDHDTFRK